MNVAPSLRTAAACAAALALTAAAAPPRYAVGDTIAGPDGGWDYASFDPSADQLYVARASNVTVVDTRTGAMPRSIGAIARGHAVVPMPDRKLVLVTSGTDDSVRFIDPSSGQETARIAVGNDPDAAFYDAARHQAIVMNAKAGTVSVIDVATRAVARTITLKPGLEFGVLGPRDTLFVNNEDANEIETADLATGKAGAAIAMPGCEGPSGLAYDARTHLLISACANGKAAIVDAGTRHEVALLDIGMGPDAVLLDADRRLAFVPCGKSGTLVMISLAGSQPIVVGTVATAAGARTGALDPRTGTMYLPTAEFGPPAKPSGRPVAKPGTFHILVIHRAA